jgi:hypothetical protein
MSAILFTFNIRKCGVIIKTDEKTKKYFTMFYGFIDFFPEAVIQEHRLIRRIT